MTLHFVPAMLLAAAACLGSPALGQSTAAPPQEADAQFYEPDSSPTGLKARPSATGSAVVSAAAPLAAAAGREMLEAGGSAADAAIATMIALTVVEPQSSGIGGGGFLMFHDARTGQTVSLDGRETAPAAARPDRFLDPSGKPIPFMEAVAGGKSVGVPGAIALAAEAHRRWGTLPWTRLFEPAIRHARDGFVVGERLNRFIVSRRDMLARDPAARSIFLDEKGNPWPTSHLLKQPLLARTLETLAKDGPDSFYRGPIGAEVTKAVANAYNNPAPLTAGDLASYRATEREPLCQPYRIWRICTMGPPSAGGIAVLQTLKQLERFDLKTLGADNLLSWHLFAESLRLAYADREAYGADPDHVPVPVAGLLDAAYLKDRSALIRIDRAMADVQPGAPPGVTARPARKLADVPGTSHFVTADRHGNMASLTSTIEGPFGSGLVAAGFVLNNELTDFDLNPIRDGQPASNRVEPGKRPRSSMAPVLVLDSAGKPVAALGAAGGATIIAQVSKALIAHLDWGQPIDAALAAPQLVADRRGLRYEQGSRLEGMAAGFKALGHVNVQPATLPLKLNALAAVPGSKGQWMAAADPRSEGVGVATSEPATAERKRR